MANVKGLRKCATVKDYSVLKKKENKVKAEKDKLRQLRKAEIEREKVLKAYRYASTDKRKMNELSYDFMEKCVQEVGNNEMLREFYMLTIADNKKALINWFADNFKDKVERAEKKLSAKDKALQALAEMDSVAMSTPKVECITDLREMVG